MENDTALDLLLQEAEGMTDDALMEVIHYMRFLKMIAVRKSAESVSGNGKRKIRLAGKYRGQGWMAVDFDAPLSDFREYM